MISAKVPQTWGSSEAAKRPRRDFPLSSSQARPVKTRPWSNGEDCFWVNDLRSEKSPIISRRTSRRGASPIPSPWGTTQRNVSQGGGVSLLVGGGDDCAAQRSNRRRQLIKSLSAFPWRMADARANNQANQ